MATRTVVTCDLCQEEIKGREPMRLSAQRHERTFDGTQDILVSKTEFGPSEFCSERCALAAVRELLK